MQFSDLKNKLFIIFRNPIFIFGFTLIIITTKMVYEFIDKLGTQINLHDINVIEFVSVNIHWMLAITVPIAYFYAISISISVTPEFKHSFVKKHLFLSGIFALIYFIHNNYVLPIQNYKARLLKKEALNEEIFETRKSFRDQNILELFKSVNKSEKEILNYEKYIKKDSNNIEEWGHRISKHENWKSQLNWEISKKIQMTAYFPLYSIIGIGFGLLARKILNKVLRLFVVYISSRLFLASSFYSLLYLNKKISEGNIYVPIGWSHFCFLVFFACMFYYLINKNRLKLIKNENSA